MNHTYTFTAELWKYPGNGAWYFVLLPKEYSNEIKTLTQGWPNKGFGTIKLEATIKDMVWDTSVFPDKKSGTYMMPVKKEVRTKLQLNDGDELNVSIKVDNI